MRDEKREKGVRSEDIMQVRRHHAGQKTSCRSEENYCGVCKDNADNTAGA